MTANQLRSSIIQFAIQGKLLPQYKEEGNAEELFLHIQAEKNKLMKNGILKKEKALTLITDDEIPFSIPETWKWVRLGNLGYFTRGNGIKRDETVKEGKPCVRYGQLYTTYKEKFYNAVSFVPKSLFDKCQKITTNDIVMALTGENNFDIALAVAYLGTEPVAMGGDITKFSHCINPMYLVYAINSAYGIQCKSKLATGQIIVHISNDKLATIPIPLPPLDEQNRIVKKLAEVLPLVEQYEKAYVRVEELNKNFPEDMKKSVLQLAFQGKLTSQDYSNENAEELCFNIKKEKELLIRKGLIKKGKTLPGVSDDEIPFDIPSNWKWVKMIDCLDVRDGTHDTPKYCDTGYPLVTSKNLKDGTIDFSTCKLISEKDYKSINQRSQVDDNDILFAMIGTIGSPVLFRGVSKFSIKNMALFKHVGDFLDMKYVYWYLYWAQFYMRKQASGGVQSFVSLNYLRNYLIPIPPREEQIRIVDTINQLFRHIESLYTIM